MRRTPDELINEARRARRAAYILAFIALICATGWGTTIGIMWNRQQNAQTAEFVGCMAVLALGVQEKGDYKFCDKYKAWIGQNTNIRTK